MLPSVALSSLLVFALLASVCGVKNDAVSSMVNSQSVKSLTKLGLDDVRRNQFPYMALLEHQGDGNCGCIIIKTNVVLTAAHCVYKKLPSNLKVKAGSYLKSDNALDKVQVRNVKEYKIHKKYNKKIAHEKDIAAVFLEQNFDVSRFVDVIALATEEERDSTYEKEVIILGWGRRVEKESSNVLQKALMKLLTKKECKKMMPKAHKVTDSMICVISEDKDKAACKGDSGGPLVRQARSTREKDLLLGVASFGIKAVYSEYLCNPQYPSVYVDIAALNCWIGEVVENKKKRFFGIFGKS